MFQRNWFRFAILLGLLWWPVSFAVAAIHVENTTDDPITVWLQSSTDQKYQGPFSVSPGTTKELPVPAGRYYVAIRGALGFEYPGWRNYSDQKITYRIVLGAPLAPIPGAGGGDYPILEITDLPASNNGVSAVSNCPQFRLVPDGIPLKGSGCVRCMKCCPVYDGSHEPLRCRVTRRNARRR